MALPSDEPKARPTVLPPALGDEEVVTQYGDINYFKAKPSASELWELSVQVGKLSPAKITPMVRGRPAIPEIDRSRWATVGDLRAAGFTVFKSGDDPNDPGHASVALTKDVPWDKQVRAAFDACFKPWDGQDEDGGST